MSSRHKGGNIIPEITVEEHDGALYAKKTYDVQLSYYQQASLVSGYVYHGFTLPGYDPTTDNFKIIRETLNSGEVLFANGAATFSNTWSAASLASVSYS